MQNDKVIIVGAGIAGLTLAIQLAANKIPCIVLEQRNSFDSITSGVRISAQGVRILEKMNVKNVGENTRRTIMHFGRISTNFTLDNAVGTSPAIMVTRLAIYEKLVEKARLLGVEIITGFNLSNVIEHPDSIEAISDAGQSITGGFLIGADGVGSVVRKILNADQNSGKQYAGYLGVGIIVPCDTKIEMSLFQYPNNYVGVASIGKVSSDDINNNVFLWTHLHMTEQETKAMMKQKVINALEAKSKDWDEELKKIFKKCKINPGAIIAYGAIYNGKMPSRWYSERMMLIGDAAHPYGPGGQGISMALKDAEALCEMFISGDLSEQKKATFQKERSEEARKFGESAALRNKPERQISSHWGIFVKGIIMRFYHFFNKGVLKSF